jgi:hypothetical protein
MRSFENKKRLRFTITLANGDRLTLEGFRAAADIEKAGGMQMGTLRARIYGVSMSDMNAVTTLQWRPDFTRPNTIEVVAIDGDSETLVFAGNIVNAWGDYRGMPDVFLHVQAQAAYFHQQRPIPPFSVSGGIDCALVMKRIADGLGLAFENNNVNVTITDIYLAGNLVDQAREVSLAGDFDYYIDDKVLAITNRYEPRVDYVAEISPESGLVGYPTFDSIGVTIEALFNPAVTFGGKVNLRTDIARASGSWTVVSLSHHLEAEKPNGAWHSVIRGSAHGFAIVK